MHSASLLCCTSLDRRAGKEKCSAGLFFGTATSAAQPRPVLLLVLTGVPGSGKSQLARLLASSPPPGVAVRVVCFDDVELAQRPGGAGAPFTAASWRAGRTAALALVREALSEHAATQTAASHAVESRVVVADDTTHTERGRAALRCLARDARCSHALLHAACDVATARVRNDARRGASRVPAAVFDEVCRACTPPDAAQPTVVSVNTGADVDVTAAWGAVLGAWGAPVGAAEAEQAEAAAARADEGRAATSASLLHAVDIASRRMVAAGVAAGAWSTAFFSPKVYSISQNVFCISHGPPPVSPPAAGLGPDARRIEAARLNGARRDALCRARATRHTLDPDEVLATLREMLSTAGDAAVNSE